jgi:hypothetical protein
LVWALLLAHHLVLGMAEGGLVLPVSLTPLMAGLDADLVADLALRLPAWSADPHVIGFCQSLVVLVGGLGSCLMVRRLLLPTWPRWLGLSGGVLALAGAGRWLVGVA